MKPTSVKANIDWHILAGLARAPAACVDSGRSAQDGNEKYCKRVAEDEINSFHGFCG